MVFVTQSFQEIKSLIDELGLFFTIKLIIRYLSLRILNTILKLFRINVYSKIKFPMTNYEVVVKFKDFYWKKLQKGLWEIDCIKILLNNVKENQIIMDVGAWIGPYTLLLSNLVGKSGKVFTFEPDPIAFQELYENIKINDMRNVIAETMGLSNYSGKASLLLNRGGGTSGSSLIRTNPDIKFKEEIIKLTTIDQYCTDNNFLPDGIIIDVEGAEGLVIEGSRKILSKHSLWVLMEFHGGFMSEEERINNWYKIVENAKKVTFIDGNSKHHSYGQTLTELPNCINFHLFIQY